jgi:hypothetical protein
MHLEAFHQSHVGGAIAMLKSLPHSPHSVEASFFR